MYSRGWKPGITSCSLNELEEDLPAVDEPAELEEDLSAVEALPRVVVPLNKPEEDLPAVEATGEP
jgi:hypothetical protein